MKTEHPLLFKAEMVLATLEDRKTQTRRLNGLEVLNDDPGAWKDVRPLTGIQADQMKAKPCSWIAFRRDSGTGVVFRCPYGEAGHSIWGRENFRYGGWTKDHVVINYLADDSAVNLKAPDGLIPKLQEKNRKWLAGIIPEEKKPPELKGLKKAPDPLRPLPCLFLPRFASRLNLKIKDIRAERLQDITSSDIMSEGIKMPTWDPITGEGEGVDPWDIWIALWDSINGSTFPWAYNPWVWRILFERMK